MRRQRSSSDSEEPKRSSSVKDYSKYFADDNRVRLERKESFEAEDIDTSQKEHMPINIPSPSKDFLEIRKL